MRSRFLTLLICAALALGVSRAAAGDAAVKKAVFAGGCFWCMQPPFDHAAGVVSTVVGYTGGQEASPSYEQVSAARTGHRESIEVTYDPAKISYEKLLDIFWHNINPTQPDGQFHDIGAQYTTAIFYADSGQEQIARRSKDALEKSGKFKQPIATKILPAAKFWPAEEYHQKYYLKNPERFETYHAGSGRVDYIKRVWGGEQ
jgi:methionine-S-sulfoxide reductase